MINRKVNGVIETKSGGFSSTDQQLLFHNSMYIVDDDLIATGLGTADNEVGMGQRIGDQILLKGISMKFMFELNERFNDVTFKVFVVRAASGDIPTQSTLFSGASNNKMMDKFNKERFSLLGYKKFKMTQPANVPAMSGALANNSEISNAGIGIGVYSADPNDATANAASRRTQMINMWIPGSRIAKYGKVQYSSGTKYPKFFSYYCIVFAYSNYSTMETVNVAMCNEYIRTLYYKDA